MDYTSPMDQLHELNSEMSKIWTVAEAKAQLSEIMRRAREEGPQRIGKQQRFVLVPEETWEQRAATKPHLGEWLTANAPRAEESDPEFILPNRHARGGRPVPFLDYATDDE